MPATGSRLERIEVDTGNDLTVDQVFKLQYDDAGLAIGELIDEDANGAYDHSFVYQYVNNRLAGSDYDRFIDGSVDVVRTFTYDSDGILQALIIDDGMIQSRVDYQLGVDGRLSGARRDFDGDSVVDQLESYVYNSNGKITTIDFDDDGDTVSDIRISYIYDEAGLVIRRERDAGVDDVVDSVWIYRYVQALCDPASNHQPFNTSCVF